MRLPLFIARRYFFQAKNRRNAVHIISWISLLGLAFGTAAMIVVLSVFNGFEGLINSLYNHFDPELKIVAERGKFFQVDSLQFKSLNHPSIEAHSFCLEEKVFIRNGDREFVATLKGVDQHFTAVNRVHEAVVEGQYFHQSQQAFPVIIGKGVSYYLSLGPYGNQANMYLPKPGLYSQRPDQAFYESGFQCTGIFSIQADFDSQYMLADLGMVQQFTRRKNQLSSVEIKLKNPQSLNEVQENLKTSWGDNFKVLSREEQQAFLFKIMQTERLAVTIIFAFILLIAAFNLIGSLSMLMLEKKEELKTLWHMGMETHSIKQIFWAQGMLIGLMGSLLGFVLGGIVCWGQATFGWVKLGATGSFIVSSYPIAFHWSDALITLLLGIGLSVLSSLIPAQWIAKKFSLYKASN